MPRLPSYCFAHRSTIDSRHERFLSGTGRESWELSSFIRGTFHRDREIISYRYVQLSTRVLYIYARYTHTQACEMKRKKNSVKQRYVKDAQRTLPLLAYTFGLLRVLSLYTDIYNRLPYKDLHTALLMLTHVWTYLSKTSLVILQGRIASPKLGGSKFRLFIFVIFPVCF